MGNVCKKNDNASINENLPISPKLNKQSKNLNKIVIDMNKIESNEPNIIMESVRNLNLKLITERKENPSKSNQKIEKFNMNGDNEIIPKINSYYIKSLKKFIQEVDSSHLFNNQFEINDHDIKNELSKLSQNKLSEFIQINENSFNLNSNLTRMNFDMNQEYNNVSHQIIKQFEHAYLENENIQLRLNNQQFEQLISQYVKLVEVIKYQIWSIINDQLKTNNFKNIDKDLDNIGKKHGLHVKIVRKQEDYIFLKIMEKFNEQNVNLLVNQRKNVFKNYINSPIPFVMLLQYQNQVFCVSLKCKNNIIDNIQKLDQNNYSIVNMEYKKSIQSSQMNYFCLNKIDDKLKSSVGKYISEQKINHSEFILFCLIDINIQFGFQNQKDLLEQILGKNNRPHQLFVKNYEQFTTQFIGNENSEYILLIQLLINGWNIESDAIKIISCCILARLIKVQFRFNLDSKANLLSEIEDFYKLIINMTTDNQSNIILLKSIKFISDELKFNLVKLIPLFIKNELENEQTIILSILKDNNFFSNILLNVKNYQIIFLNALSKELNVTINHKLISEHYESGLSTKVSKNCFKDQFIVDSSSIISIKLLSFFKLNPVCNAYYSPFIFAFELLKNGDQLNSVHSFVRRYYHRVPTCDNGSGFLFQIELLSIIFSNADQFKILFPFEAFKTAKLDFLDDKHVSVRDELQVSFLKLKGRAHGLDMNSLVLWVYLQSLNQYYLNVDCSRSLTEIYTIMLKQYGNVINSTNARTGHNFIDSILSLIQNLNQFKEKPDNNLLSQIKEVLIQNESVFDSQIQPSPLNSPKISVSNQKNSPSPSKRNYLSPYDDPDDKNLDNLLQSGYSHALVESPERNQTNQPDQMRLLFNNPLFLLISSHGQLVKIETVRKILELLSEECLSGASDHNLSFNSCYTDPLFGHDNKSVYSNMTSRKDHTPKVSLLNHRKFKKFTIPNYLTNHSILINGQFYEKHLWNQQQNTLSEKIDESIENTNSESSIRQNKQELLRYQPIDKIMIKNSKFSKQISLDYFLIKHIGYTNIKKVSSGYKFIVFISEKDDIQTMGDNSMGQLGIGNNLIEQNNVYYNLNKIESNLGECKFLTCGYEHVIYINSTDQIQTWGQNMQDSNIETMHTTFKILTPKLIQFNLNNIQIEEQKHQENIKEIKRHLSKPRSITHAAAGAQHQFIVVNERILLCWGMADRAQLPLDEQQLQEFAEEGQIYRQAGSPQLVDFAESVSDIQCGESHSLILSKGKLLACGTNDIGQCAMGQEVMQVPAFKHIEQFHNKVRSFSTGGAHSMVITTDDKLYGFGKNLNCQAGLPGVEVAQEPMEVEAISSPLVAKKVWCGPDASVVLSSLSEMDKNDQMTWAFGRNHSGVLYNSTKDDLSPTIMQQLQGLNQRDVILNYDMAMFIKF